MKYGQSILVFDGEKWITVLYVKHEGDKVWYRHMNGYGRSKSTTTDRVRDIYLGKGDLPKFNKKYEELIKWKN